jgi:sulfur-carrier protein
MDIEVLFFGKLRELSGIRKIVVSVGESARLSDLIKQLGERFGSAFQTGVDHLQGLRILVNGREHGLLGGRETRLRHKDNVVFLPPLGGG